MIRREILPVLSDDQTGIRFKTDDVLEYCLAPELGYDMDPDGKSGDARRGGGWDLPTTVPWQYRVRLTGLDADTAYGYRVQLTGDASYENTFRTSPDPAKWRGFKFIYFSDSETQPEDNDASSGLTTDWDIPTGSPRTSWDEFWRHNAGPLNDPAASIPILVSPGNHDYWSYNDGGNVGITKYLSYFECEPNQATVGDAADLVISVGDYASADLKDIADSGVQMFGVLKVKADRLAYDFYVAEEDGTSTLVDTLRVCKPELANGLSVMSR